MDYDGDRSNGSTPRLPPIESGYDTPGSDYMTAFRHKQKPHPTMLGDSDKIDSVPYPSSHRGSTSKSHSGSCGKSKDGSTRRRSSRGSTCSRHNEHLFGNGEPNTVITELIVGNGKRRSVGREITMPSTGQPKQSSLKKRPSTDAGVCNTSAISPLKLSLPGSASTRLYSAGTSMDSRKRSWNPPRISKRRYADARARVMDGGKFKSRLQTYFREDIPWWESKPESDDDGYDTDLDKQLGFELIADEKSREILEDGAFPEYKKECRKFRSNPNSYFLRHCLDDEVQMRHRYLSKGDSITVSNLVKNHLTLTSVDLDDNGIGPHGMKYFKNVLHENKHLTELYLSCNNLGPLGAKHLQSSLVSNCFLQKLDISDNKFGDKGGKYCATIIEDNVSLKELNISCNEIGDEGAVLISKALGNNVSLKVLDISWNKIRLQGALKLSEALKKNTELEVFLVGMNGFGDEGGRAIFSAIRHVNIIREVDLSANRLTDSVLGMLGSSFDSMTSLQQISLANNAFTSKAVIEFLTSLMANPSSVKHVNLEGVIINDDMKGLCSALRLIHEIHVDMVDPPCQREVTTDILTRNLTIIARFLIDEELDIEDLFPDWEEEDEECSLMLTTDEVITAIECCGQMTRFDKLHKLRSKLKYGKKRKFSIREFCVLYEHMLNGKDPLCEMPLRTHLRKSIREEREEEERKAKQQKARSYSSVVSTVGQSRQTDE